MGLANLVPGNTRYKGPEMAGDHQALASSPESVVGLSHDDDKDSNTESRRSSFLNSRPKRGIGAFTGVWLSILGRYERKVH
jgi:hypothetical protein